MDSPEPTRVLAAAAAAARHAPSIHNTQPWRWRVDGTVLELRADPARALAALDPDRRLLLTSCGAALHHARVALAAQGWTAEVDRPVDGDLLARLTLADHVGADPAAMRLLQVSEIRFTDRRPGLSEPPPGPAVDAVVRAAEGEGVQVFLVPPDRVVELAVAVAHAQDAEAGEPAQREELARWVGGDRTAGTGIPDSAIPAEPAQTTVPGRDFGPTGRLAVGEAHAPHDRFGVLYGPGDAPRDWLRAGEALSAAWLTAVDNGLTLAPFSAPVEVTSTREALRRLLAGIGHPYIAVRLGQADPAHHGPGPTPRLPAEQIVEVVS